MFFPKAYGRRLDQPNAKWINRVLAKEKRRQSAEGTGFVRRGTRMIGCSAGGLMQAPRQCQQGLQSDWNWGPCLIGPQVSKHLITLLQGVQHPLEPEPSFVLGHSFRLLALYGVMFIIAILFSRAFKPVGLLPRALSRCR